jgi:hypothetical protein
MDKSERSPTIVNRLERQNVTGALMTNNCGLLSGVSDKPTFTCMGHSLP